jgi:pyruvate/2-oxoglutarate dehydrogenase complex dihydrolipoamide acyltransferase (E2) component
LSKTIEIRVPDIGDFKDIPVIEVLVKQGDRVQPEDGLVTLESDKATMEVPAPAAGTIRELRLKLGDKVSQGDLVAILEVEEAAVQEAPAAADSRVRITTPSATLSPSLTLSSRTVPAAGEGTSIVALSDSSVTSGSSALTTSPGLTRTSMTGTSLKSPMSGTLTSIVLMSASVVVRASPAACRRAAHRGTR